MRTVAVLLAFLAIPAVMPTAMAAPNDCNVVVASARVCVALPLPNPAAKTFYVYAGDTSCTVVPWGPTSNSCRGQTSIVYGTVYEETNGLGGLQRESVTWNGRNFPADKVLLL